MTPFQICFVGLCYYFFILLISKIASWKSSELEYIKTQAPAWLITLGIVGDSISGVTYLSVPGTVEQKGFSYLALCLGHVLGYLIIAHLYLPLFNRKNFSSVYEWIGNELGVEAQKISSCLFVISRIFGSAARLCLTATVIHLFVFKNFNIGPELSILAVTLGISIYTLRSGIKSLIVTDTVQSGFLVLGVLGTTVYLFDFLKTQQVDVQFFRPLFLESGVPGWMGFIKGVLSGILITLSMTGLDQNIMQKTFSATNLEALKKNFVRIGFVILAVNFFVLVQGSMLQQSGLFLTNVAESPADQKLIQFVLGGQSIFFQILFFLGLSAATLNSADSVITTVTSSIKIDLLKTTRFGLTQIHALTTGLLAVTALLIHQFSTEATIDLVLKSAGWTYGPLLGFFAIAILKTKSSKKSLRFALATSVLTALVIHHYSPLGVEVILVISAGLIFYNWVYSNVFTEPTQ